MKDKNLNIVKKSFFKNIPPLSEALRSVKYFSMKEAAFFISLILIFVISTTSILWKINKKYLVEIPTDGGIIIEGIIGAPRFINPILATSEADRDLDSLIYSGLMRVGPDGNLIPDLALNYNISDDGLNYTFKIRSNAFWHDGQPVSADDIIFTVEKAKDPLIKSPKRSNWEGVMVKKIDDTTVMFSLKQAYSLFLENTTMGILPKHIWKNTDPEVFSYNTFNLEPIGSGPYKIKNLVRKSSGVPDYYDLAAFKNFVLGRPKIDNVRIKFYANEESLLYGLQNKNIEAISLVSPEKIENIKKTGAKIETSILPRVFAVFFNQNQSPVLSDIKVRQALDVSLDKNKITQSVLKGYGAMIDGPIPPGSIGYNKESTPTIKSEDERLKTATSLLKSSGWSFDQKNGIWEKKINKEKVQLKFSIATADVPQLKETVELIKQEWEKLGIIVEIKIFEVGDLNQNIIRPRKYEALFFGEVVGRYPDLFSFWHSSQRNDPGLNVSMYANSKVDKILESIRSELDDKKRAKLYSQFQNELTKDTPAIFVYSPNFIYAVPKKIKGLSLTPLTTSSERFLNIYRWYTDTDFVWKIFVKSTNK